MSTSTRSLQRSADENLAVAIPCPIEGLTCPRKLARTITGHVIPALDFCTLPHDDRAPQAQLIACHPVLTECEGGAVRVALSGFDAETFEAIRQPTAVVFPGVLSPPFVSPLRSPLHGDGVAMARSVHVSSLANPRSTYRDVGLRRSRMITGRVSRRSSCPGSGGSPSPATFEKRTRTSATPLDLAEGSSSSRPDITSLRAWLAAAETEVAVTRVALALVEGGFVVNLASGSRRSQC